MSEQLNETLDDPIVGRVKWFDAERGFGFVVAEGLDRDVLLHVNALRAFGKAGVIDGAAIEMVVAVGERGFQVSEILTLDAPEDVEVAADLPPVDTSVPLRPARVKWFDKGKGFGFANVWGETDDVFVHVDVLRRFGVAALGPGEAISVRAVEGARGRQAVEVREWGFSGE